MNELLTSVTSVPADVRAALAKWAANRVAFGYVLSNKDRGDNHVGTIRCSPPTGPTLNDPVYDIEAFEVLHCLDTRLQSTYFDCLDIILKNRSDGHSGLRCSWSGFRPEYDPQTAPASFDAKRITDQEISDAFIGPPPPLEIQLMLMGVPGMVGPKGAFCVQGIDWACAPDPFDVDQSPTTSAASGGGDR